jgi:hypothetical protein
MSANLTRDDEHAEKGAPSEGKVVVDHFSTNQIFQRVLATRSRDHSSCGY